MDREELIARAIERAEAYDTPKADDARRRYTPAQLQIAIRHALAALESRPAPTEERAREVLREVSGAAPNVESKLEPWSVCIRAMLRFAQEVCDAPKS